MPDLVAGVLLTVKLLQVKFQLGKKSKFQILVEFSFYWFVVVWMNYKCKLSEWLEHQMWVRPIETEITWKNSHDRFTLFKNSLAYYFSALVTLRVNWEMVLLGMCNWLSARNFVKRVVVQFSQGGWDRSMSSVTRWGGQRFCRTVFVGKVLPIGSPL